MEFFFPLSSPLINLERKKGKSRKEKYGGPISKNRSLFIILGFFFLLITVILFFHFRGDCLFFEGQKLQCSDTIEVLYYLNFAFMALGVGFLAGSLLKK